MSPAISRRAIIGFGLGFAILAVNALIAYQAIVSLREATRSVEDGLQVVDLLRSVSSAVADSEAWQRGYIISEKKEYLEDSTEVLRVADRMLNDIRALIGNDAAEREKIGSLQSTIAARTAEFEHTLALLTNGDRRGALKAISTEGSRRNLEGTYELFTQLSAKQNALFTQRTRQLQENSHFSLATQYIATFFGLVFLGLIYYLVYREITVRRQTEEKLRIVATHDPLTALPNRTLLHERLSHALAKAQRHNRQLAVLLVDLDRFKHVNDTLGHEAGDALLQVAARRFYDCLRETDTMARQGGDEFVVLMDELLDREPITRVSQRILDAMVQPFVIDGHEIHISASVGISVYPDDGRTLLRNADIALYRAKEKGRNNYQFYSAQIDNYSRERLTLESGLRRALERDELSLHYQPKVDLAAGHICGMEALLRWQHPQMGWVAPDRFIPIAEESGLIRPIGAWVLKTACMQNRAWQRQGVQRFPVAVNLSPRQFAEESLLDDIKSALAESGLDGSDLELEITEGMVMNDPEQAISMLRRLKELGIRVAIDDFGTGYSSLAYLKRFPIDSVKVDRSFVQDIPEDVNSMAIAQAIIAMAHSLRLRVVAEGVESEAQLAFLRGEGCDEIQGQYFSEARAASEISAIMRKTLRRGSAVFLSERRRKALA
ncbi:MAG TPA: EAL domain-containing protein [Burkholderiales bacterium]|nr:EAL domain-containing protein [Burkholderiales bacterium]